MSSNPSPEETISPIRVLLVCHAGAALGIGHLTRMLALATALESGSAEIRLLIQGDRVGRNDLSGLAHSFIDIEVDLFGGVIETCDRFEPDVVVFDLHPKLLPPDFADRSIELRERDIHLVGVDSLLPLCDSLDLTWVPSLMVGDAEIAGCEEAVYWGWDSFLISKRLSAKEWAPGTRVLVLTGGSDVTRQHGTLPALLDAQLPDRSEIWWVQGPFAPAPELPAEPRLEWVIHEAPAGLDELIVGADYAITVFGVTLFELLQYGTPTVVFSPYQDREFPELGSVTAAGAAVVADDADVAVAELVALMADDDRARAYSQKALDRMSVNGADRLAELIQSLTE